MDQFTKQLPIEFDIFKSLLPFITNFMAIPNLFWLPKVPVAILKPFSLSYLYNAFMRQYPIINVSHFICNINSRIIQIETEKLATLSDFLYLKMLFLL